MPESELRVHNLPRDVREEELAGSIVVVIDLLRATSTICQALASGASEVVPFLEIDDAVAAAATAGRANVVLGGERSGGKIPGFDVGNSPAEYSPRAVGGKRVFMTTTNGTRALYHARFGSRIVLGSFLNLSAVVHSIRNAPRIDILCAGTDGLETEEDIFAAGAIVRSLIGMRDATSARNVIGAAREADEKWQQVISQAALNGRPIRDELATALRHTRGGRNLIGIGLDQDIVDCAQIDCLSVVPELDVRAWRIVPQSH